MRCADAGFPLPPGSYRTRRRDPSAGFERLVRTSIRRERADPDVEIAPSGFPEPPQYPDRYDQEDGGGPNSILDLVLLAASLENI